MKKILIALVAYTTVVAQHAHASAFLTFLDPIRTEIVNQQVIVSNAPALDKPLATALRKALLQIDRPTPTNLVNDTKALSSIAATLNKTSLSNTFDPLIRTALANYAGVVGSALHSASNSLLATFPSGPRTAGNNLIAQAFDSVDAAIASGNTTTGTKALAAVTKKLGVVNSLLNKALNAPAPPVQFRATITASGEGSFNFQPTPARAAAATLTGNTLQIIGVQVQSIGRTSVRTRYLTVAIPNIIEGTHVYNVSQAGGDATVLYVLTEGNIGGGGSGDSYNATSGTITATWNSATRAAVGSFTFSGTGANMPANTASSDNGVFSVVAQQ